VINSLKQLPDKSIASLVKYYYSWKKTRSRTSLMDKQARKLNTPKEEGGASEAGSEGGSNEESDHDEKVRIVSNIFACLLYFVRFML
jgi:hypothetical protein